MAVTTDAYDVVVIGAGLVGALVARQLAEEELAVAVLEANDTVGGIAARGAGLALLGTPTLYSVLQSQLGIEPAQQVWHLTQENLTRLQDLLQKLDQPVARVGSFRPTLHSAEASQLQHSVSLLQSEGYTAALDDATEQGFLIAITTQDDIAFDPSLLIPVLLEHPNIHLETRTEVQTIKPNPTAKSASPLLTISARKRTLWAKGVVLTGGAHGIRLSHSLGSIVSPQVLHTVDFKYTAPLPAPLILENGQVIVQPYADGWRMVACASAGNDALKLVQETTQQLCPNAPVLARHSTWGAVSSDGLPVVGMLPDMPNVYTISGLGPWGLSWACVAAQRLVELMIRDVDPGLLRIGRLFPR